MPVDSKWVYQKALQPAQSVFLYLQEFKLENFQFAWSTKTCCLSISEQKHWMKCGVSFWGVILLNLEKKQKQVIGKFKACFEIWVSNVLSHSDVFTIFLWMLIKMINKVRYCCFLCRFAPSLEYLVSFSTFSHAIRREFSFQGTRSPPDVFFETRTVCFCKVCLSS